MRKITFCVALYLCTAAYSAEQDSQAPAAETAADSAPPESYVVQLTEYRLKSAIAPSLSTAEIVALLTNEGDQQKNEPIETIRLSTLSGTESMVQFGKRASVSSGTVSSGRGSVMRQTQTVQIGTIVRVEANPQAGKVAVTIDFESSRLEGDGTAESPPDISTTQISTTQLMEIGKPTLIGGTTAGETSFILLTVSR